MQDKSQEMKMQTANVKANTLVTGNLKLNQKL
jgi:hypothetical protein